MSEDVTIALGFGPWLLNETLFRVVGRPRGTLERIFRSAAPSRTPSESVEAPGTSPSYPLEPRFSMAFKSFPSSWKPEPAPDVPTSSPNLSKTVFSLLGPLKIDFPCLQSPENRYIIPPQPRKTTMFCPRTFDNEYFRWAEAFGLWRVEPICQPGGSGVACSLGSPRNRPDHTHSNSA